MDRRWWARGRLAAGAVILAVLVWRLGTGPIRTGLRGLDPWVLVAAAGIGAVTTTAGAWRWRRIAQGLGVGLPLGRAVAACYRSQLLNTALPGGVLGDVHRGVAHGHAAGNVSAGLRAVAWERGAGQAVQVVLAVLAVLLLPSPVHTLAPFLAAGLLLTAAGGYALLRRPARGAGRRGRALRTVRGDLAGGVLARGAWPVVLLASVLAVAGHVATFLLAARTAGVHAPLARLVPLALLVLVATAVPTSVGGWGPREGAAAALFGGAGLGAAAGLATAVAFGVLVLAASAPGLAVLLAGWLRRGARPQVPVPAPSSPVPARVVPLRRPAAAPAGRWAPAERWAPEGTARG
jgi:uncharacterized membrane protein YbhN (UPF0104 family)